MASSVKENVKYKTFLAQNIQKIWDTMGRSNLRITEIDEGKEIQVKNTELKKKNKTKQGNFLRSEK